MKVRIDAGGREVEVECSDSNVSPSDLLGEPIGTVPAAQRKVLDRLRLPAGVSPR